MTTETLRLYPGGPEVGYDLGREAGEGVVLSIDLAGHHDLDVVDLVLADVSAYPDEFGTPWGDDADNPATFGYLGIEHLWRSTRHPEGCDDPDGEDCFCDYNEWYYSPTETEGAVPVTRLSPDHSWDRRCAWHPKEAASSAIPYAEYRALEPDVAVTNRHGSGYVYLCRPCYVSAGDRIDEARRQRVESFERLTAAGFTPNQAARMCVPTVAAPTTEERQT